MKKSSNSFAVVGLGFGDEGKGVSVNSLVNQLFNPLVVRYSGGQQAGHTVTLDDGTSHVFSNFGAGTLKGAPTYWSKHCTFDPVGFVNELTVLQQKGFSPKIYIDKKSPVTTPFDKLANQTCKENAKHGTCGAGVGATFAREAARYSLLVEDLLSPSIFQIKLNLIKNYRDNNAVYQDFINCVEYIKQQPFVHFVDEMPDYPNIVFESSQGLLLDQDIGFFPHVTRSNLGSKTLLEMGFDPHYFLVTRAFQTRHGNGPMTNQNLPNNIKHNPLETNILNRYQGEFKRSLLDLDLLRYGISRDERIKNTPNKSLVITCLDLVEDEYRFTVNGKIESHSNRKSFVQAIANYLNISVVYEIDSPNGVFSIYKDKEAFSAC